MTPRVPHRPGRPSALLGLAVTLCLLAPAPGARAEDPTPTAVPEGRSGDPVRAADFETPRGLALGTGARASAVSTSAIAYSAAGLAAGRMYHLEGFYGYAPGADTMGVGAGVSDSMTSALAAGFMMRGIFDLDDGGYGGWDGRLALALAAGEALSFGVSGRYVHLERRGDGGGGNYGVDGDDLAKGFTMDASARLTLGGMFHVVALGENLIAIDSPLAPQRVGGGVAFAVDMFSLGADVLVDLSTFDGPELLLGGGLELLVAGVVPIRVGYRFDQGRQEHMLTGGLGYVDTSMGFEAGVRQGLVGTKDTQLMASFRYFVQ